MKRARAKSRVSRNRRKKAGMTTDGFNCTQGSGNSTIVHKCTSGISSRARSKHVRSKSRGSSKRKNRSTINSSLTQQIENPRVVGGVQLFTQTAVGSDSSLHRYASGQTNLQPNKKLRFQTGAFDPPLYQNVEAADVEGSTAFNILTKPADVTAGFNRPDFSYNNLPHGQIDTIEGDHPGQQQQYVFNPASGSATVAQPRKLASMSKFSSILKNSSAGKAHGREVDHNESELSTPRGDTGSKKFLGPLAPSMTGSNSQFEQVGLLSTAQRMFYRGRDDLLSSDSDEYDTPQMTRHRSKRFIDKVQHAMRGQRASQRPAHAC